MEKKVRPQRAKEKGVPRREPARSMAMYLKNMRTKMTRSWMATDPKLKLLRRKAQAIRLWVVGSRKLPQQLHAKLHLVLVLVERTPDIMLALQTTALPLISRVLITRQSNRKAFMETDDMMLTLTVPITLLSKIHTMMKMQTMLPKTLMSICMALKMSQSQDLPNCKLVFT